MAWGVAITIRLLCTSRLEDGSVAASAFLGGGWLDPNCPERLPCDAELRGASAAAGAAPSASSGASGSPRWKPEGFPLRKCSASVACLHMRSVLDAWGWC